MTDSNGADATLADLLASRGRDALVERLRKAYADAAASHSDVVSLDAERIEALVQSAADRADGLQWRRALANVASQELGVSLAEALTHPAVREAQEKLGAPSYEASLAELVPSSAPSAADPEPENAEPEIEQQPAAAAPPQPQTLSDEPEDDGATGELESVEADHEIFELLPSPEPTEYEVGSYEAIADEQQVGEPTQVHALDDLAHELTEPLAGSLDSEAPSAVLDVPLPLPLPLPLPGEPAPATDEPAPATEEPAPAAPEPANGAVEQSYGETHGGEHTDYPPPADDSVQVLAHHLGGVANLPTGRDGLGLRLSESGLDILQPEGEIIGRLHWNEIDALEVIAVRGRLRRQARSHSRIVVRTKHGDASFEIPGLSSEELRTRVEPLVSRYGDA